MPSMELERATYQEVAVDECNPRPGLNCIVDIPDLDLVQRPSANNFNATGHRGRRRAGRGQELGPGLLALSQNYLGTYHINQQ